MTSFFSDGKRTTQRFKRGDVVRVDMRFDRKKFSIASNRLGVGELTVEAVRDTHPDDMRGVGHPQQVYINGTCWSGAWFLLVERYERKRRR